MTVWSEPAIDWNGQKCVHLWRTVIQQALVDLAPFRGETGSQRYRDEYVPAHLESLEFFFGSSELEQVCDLAKLEPDAIRQEARHILLRGYCERLLAER